MTDREPFSVLVSFWYYRGAAAIRSITEALGEARDQGQPVRLILDSGAFSAHTQGHEITTADYARWLDQVVPLWAPWLVGAINLDVIGDPVASWENWNDLAERGHTTVPVTHLGDPFDVADRYVDAGCDYLATGNLVGSAEDRMMRWVAHLFLHLKRNHPHVRLHGLGLTGRRAVERFPWWSVDSSSFGSSYRYGRLTLFDPKSARVITVPLPGHRITTMDRTTDLYRHGRLLRDVYGVDPADIHEATPANRHLLVRIAALSIMGWQANLRSRRPVPAPPSLAGPDGTHVHHAEGWHTYSAQAIGSHVHFVDANASFVSQAMASVGTHLHYVDTSTSYLPRAITGAAQPEG